MTDKTYHTVREIAEEFPFSEASLRSILFNRDSNNFNRCVRKIGSRIFIERQELIRWIEADGGHYNT